MGLETTTTISGLNETWPLGTDPRNEGDNHIRTTKTVLKNTFDDGTAGELKIKVGGSTALVVNADGSLENASGKLLGVTAQAYNRVVNGAMQHSQENGDATTAAVTNFVYWPADQWTTAWSLSPGTVVSQRLSGVTPNNSSKVLYLGISTAKPSLGASDYFFTEHKLEGARVADFQWGTATARQVVLRFWVWAQVAGTYSIQLQNSAADRSYIAGFTVAAGEASTWKQVVLVIPGDTTGTWLKDNGLGIVLRFVWAQGSTSLGVAGWQAGNKIGLTGQSNGAATAMTNIQIADVGLYLDPDATGVPPKWVPPDYASELAACRRYWARNFSAHGVWSSATTTFRTVFPLKQPMRVAPTLTVSNAAGAIEEYNVAFRDLGALPAISCSTAIDSVESFSVTTAAATAIGKNGGLLSERLIFNARM